MSENHNENEPQEQPPAPMEIPPCPEDPRTPILSGVSRLVRSSKALVALGATGVVGYLAAIGKVPAPEALEVITWIIGLLLGAVAVEDAAGKLSGRVRGTTQGRANWIMQMLMPVLGNVVESMKRPPPSPGPAPMGMAPPGVPLEPPMALVPITAQHFNTLVGMALEEGMRPEPFAAAFVQEALDEALKAETPKKPEDGKAKKGS